MITHLLLSAVLAAGGTGKALHDAACRGDTAGVRRLLKKATPDALNAVDPKQYDTPLMCAVERRHLPVVRALLEAKADPNAGGGTLEPLTNAAFIDSDKQAEEMVRVLLAAGARADVADHGDSRVDAVTAAAGRKTAAILKVLLESGAPAEGRDRQCFPMERAVEYRRPESVKLLIERGGTCGGIGRFGPWLASACWYGDEEIIRAFLDHGADPNARGGPNRMPALLQCLPASPRAAVLELMASRGMDPNAVDGEGNGAAYHALKGKFPEESLVWLLDRGVDIRPACDRLLAIGSDVAARALTHGCHRETAEERSAKVPLDAIILGGAQTEEGANAGFMQYMEKGMTAGRFVGLAQGFPDVRRSDEFEGLKPGFRVVLLGFCSGTKAADSLEILRAFFPGTYTRKVRVKPSLEACPTVARGIIAQESLPAADGAKLVVTVLDDQEQPLAHAVLVQKETVLAEQDVPLASTIREGDRFKKECPASLRAGPDGVTAEVTCQYWEDECIREQPSVWRFGAAGGKIELKTSEGESTLVKCPEN